MVLLFERHSTPETIPGHCAIAKATKSERATSLLPSRGAKSGRNCYITLAFLGVPNKGDKIRSGYITPALEK